ncbi:3-oxoacyl-ACP synthase [Stenotrophomonas rhizophila]|uniref:beta-ketoacyl synthase chain length factor n=1 Tax=Stenotrophomonas rhizophila TaxID=216778 RepID=UPI000BA6D642|nr:beta-ketoacyl synthase chain length factor [Stenotrophomonas rhizophila]PAK92891.1 3-oxoacyl-ACP synthase [Stenotrophomonas rhizophila]
MIEFSVVDWSAWAPGLTTKSHWQAWAHAPALPEGDDTPGLPEVPAMQRRRIERLGRMAIQAACWCEQPDDAGQVPLVFASRHGDVARSMELLDTLRQDAPMSPTGFGLSVHNAVAALYSIARGQRGNYLALAGGRGTVEAACVEAFGLLADGAPEVRVIAYESPLPAVYAGFADEPDPFFAWCWRLARADAPGTRLSLGWGRGGQDSPPGALPHSLDALRFLLSGEPALRFQADGQQWSWQRHG